MINRKDKFLFAFCILLTSSNTCGEDFGRFFTTPKQREQLEDLRRSKSKVVVEINQEELEIEKDVVVDVSRRDKLKVKGLVYRSDGKNSAWINDSNSYEGDITSGYTNVDNNRIYRDRVEVGVGDDGETLTLKVGQTFNPDNGEINDVTNPAADEYPDPGQSTD